MTENSVQSLERAFNLLEILSKHPKGAALSEITEASGLNKSTVHRLLSSLIGLNYVAQDEISHQYRLTIKLYEVGSKVVRDIDIISMARPYISALGSSLGEIVNLSIPAGSDILYVYMEENAKNAIKVENRLGDRNPMYCTACGKAMLADMSNEAIYKIWNKSKIEKRTQTTITDYNQLMDEISLIRKRGYAFDNEEQEAGIFCTAVSISDYAGKVHGAVSVSVPMIRATTNPDSAVVTELLELRRKLCADYGNTRV